MVSDALTPTERVYLEDTHLFTLSSKVVAVQVVGEDDVRLRRNGSHIVMVQRTIFHVQGGGQPSDIGTITATDGSFVFTVNFVTSDAANRVLHVGTWSNGGDGAGAVGQSVKLSIDKSKRMMFARLHSAGHAIDAAMKRVGALDKLQATKGHHFVDDPHVEYVGELDDELLKTLPEKLNAALAELVEGNVKTLVENMSNDEASKKCGSDLSAYPANVRVVSVAGIPVPCGGSHVKETRELGLVTVTKVKKKKSTYKVSYVIN